jgi:DNA-binding CsgD family transcriptional regulator
VTSQSGCVGPTDGESTGSEDQHEVLSPREVEILRAVSSGHTTREISEQLEISAKTVENHKQRIFTKLGVRNQAHAVALTAVQLVPDRAGGSPRCPELSRRERQILEAIDRGLSVKQTARALGVAPKTVENLQGRLFAKLRVRNRAQAVYRGHRMGLLPDQGRRADAASGE